VTAYSQDSRPGIVDDEHLDFLDKLRSSGSINMFAAAPLLRRAFDNLSEKESRVVLAYWMETFPRETQQPSAINSGETK